MKNKKNTITYYAIIMAVVFGLIFLWNCLTGYTGDDYMYHYFFEGKMPSATPEPLIKLSELPGSLWNHYLLWNGRIVTHTFVQFFMMYHKIVFNICNSVVFLLTGIVLMFHIRKNPKNWSPQMMVLIYTAMFFFFPHFGLSVLWLAGACNYLWMCALLLLFLLFYRSYKGQMEKQSVLRTISRTTGMFLLGVLSGCSNENSGGAIILLAVFFVGYWMWKKWKIPAWGVSGIIGAISGLLFLLAAPSSTNRIGSGLFESGVLLKRLREFCGFSVRYLLILCILLLIVSIKYYEEKNLEGFIVPILYCLAGTASVVVLIASPVISGKSWIWAVSFMMIAIGMIWDEISDEKWKKRRLIKGGIQFFICLTVIRYAVATVDLAQTWKEQMAQVAAIEQSKENGETEVTIELLTPTDNLYNAISRTPNVDSDSEDWFNQWMALYYGVDKISGEEKINE